MLHHHISLQYLNNEHLQKVQLQNQALGVPDFARALTQYDDLCTALSNLGATVSVLPCQTSWLSRYAVLAGRIAVIGRTDKKELEFKHNTIASVLAGDSLLKFIDAPGIIDGRDVVLIGDTFMVGICDTTNHSGAEQLAACVQEAGFKVAVMESLPADAMHLQDHLMDARDRKVIVSDVLEKHFALMGYDKIVIDSKENIIPNAISINGNILIASGFIEQEQRLVKNNIAIVPVNLSEFAKLGIPLNTLTLQTVKLPVQTEKPVTQTVAVQA